MLLINHTIKFKFQHNC